MAIVESKVKSNRKEVSYSITYQVMTTAELLQFARTFWHDKHRCACFVYFQPLHQQTAKQRGANVMNRSGGNILGSPRALEEQPRVARPFEYLGKIRSAALDHVIKEAAAVAPYRSLNILIEGERGTGKEIMARSIHRAYRPMDPFLGINCASYSGDTVKSELFGHVRGAFTGAFSDKNGDFERVGSGTLLLDEVARLDTDIQGMLLRTLQEKEFRPIGGKKWIPFEGRVVCATNLDLRQLAQDGWFLPDFLDRIAGTTIRLPTLAEQRDIICLGFRHFVQVFCRDEMIMPEVKVEDDIDPFLLSHTWPGNFRELQNVAKKAAATANAADGVIRLDVVRGIINSGTGNGRQLRSLHRVTLENFRMVVSATGSLAAAARDLNMPSSTVKDICVRYGIRYNRAPQGRRKNNG